MSCLGHDAILASTIDHKEKVLVPDFANGDSEAYVWVRMLSGAERDAFEQASLDRKGRPNLQNIPARLCAICIVDDDGKSVLKPYEAEALGTKSARALDRIFSVAQKMNGITDDDIEELAKNSETIPGGDST